MTPISHAPTVSRPRRRPVPVLAAVALLALGGCGETAGIPAPEVPGRPDDGLLDEPVLQSVVDLQVARDGRALAELLTHDDPRVRARAAFGLASVGEPAAVPALVEALDDPSARVRADAALALGRVEYGTDEDDPPAEPVATALLEALGSEPSEDVRRVLIDAVGRVGGPAAIDALAAFGDPRLTADVHMALSRAVVRGIESEAAVERVSTGLTHADPGVRMASAYLMASSDNTAVWYGERRRARLALQTYDKDDPAAMWVIQGLGRSGDFYSRSLFPEWARESPDWRVRVNALRAVGQRFPDVATMDLLLDMLDDPSAHVRIAAVEAMGEFALPPLHLDRIEAWIGANPGDWRTTGHLLGVLALNGREGFVMDRLEDVPLSDLERWRLGIEALAYLGSEAVFATLVGLLDSPHREIAVAAMESLVTRWTGDRAMEVTHGPYWNLLSRVLREGGPDLVAAAAPAVVDPAFRERGSLELLRAAWERMDDATPAARVAVLEVLGEAGDPASLELLQEALRDPHPGVREAAGSAITEVAGGSVDVPGQSEVGERRDRTDPALPDFLGDRIDWNRLGALGPHPLLHLETDRGTIVLRLDAEEAPWTVQTVAELAAEGKYDGVPFHRVVPNFVIQGGDFDRRDGTGGPGFRIGSELTAIPFERGVVGMASSGPDTEGSQFFVTHSRQPHLDGGYTAFGYVVRGMDVVDRIQIGDLVRSARVEPGR